MSVSVSRTYFQISPLNNVSSGYTPTNGQDTIQFIIPPVAMMLEELVMFGTLSVQCTNPDGGAVSRYNEDIRFADNPQEVLLGLDNVIGVHALINKIEINSRRANIILEQRLDYDMVAKWQVGAGMSKNDLLVGMMANTCLCSSKTLGSTNKMVQNVFPNGSAAPVPFMLTFNTALLAQKLDIPLDQIGGLMITVYLNSVRQALFNVDNGLANLIDDQTSFAILQPNLFGRYKLPSKEIVVPEIPLSLIDTNLQIVQSANDTIQFTPYAQSLSSIVSVYQPNNQSRNNTEVCATKIDQLIGLQQYTLGKDGQHYPLDYDVSVLPDLYNTSHAYISGNAEQTFMNSVALAGSYPPGHSLLGPTAEYYGNLDAEEKTNEDCTNISVLACSYQYGFIGYNTSMSNNLAGYSLKSAVKAPIKAGSVIPDTYAVQAQSNRNFIVKNGVCSLKNLMVMS
jgi:hypothetical protein